MFHDQWEFSGLNSMLAYRHQATNWTVAAFLRYKQLHTPVTSNINKPFRTFFSAEALPVQLILAARTASAAIGSKVFINTRNRT